MRGNNDTPQSFWYSIDLEELIEADHPLRAIKRMVDEALRCMDKDVRKAYSDRGRRSVALSLRVRSRLLKALLLQALYSIRSERELCRCLKTDLLFRWVLRETEPTRHRGEARLLQPVDRQRLDTRGTSAVSVRKSTPLGSPFRWSGSASTMRA